MTEGAGALPLTTYIGCGPNAPRVWYMLKYLCTRGAVAAVSRYEWWCVLLECICTLSLDPRLLRARAHFNILTPLKYGPITITLPTSAQSRNSPAVKLNGHSSSLCEEPTTGSFRVRTKGAQDNVERNR